jgi:hypothetical protein
MKRFSLKSLLILVTVVGLFFGYSQWRGNRIRSECSDLEQKGIVIFLPSEKRDYLWQRLPTDAKFTTVMSYTDTMDAVERLQRLGIKEPRPDIIWANSREELLGSE